MTEIISVRFNNKGKSYYFSPSGLVVEKGTHVVVETAKGPEYGECTQGNRMVNDDAIIKPLRPIIRIATEADTMSTRAGKEKEKVAFAFCQNKITELGLDMRLVNVEYGFEGSKILFFFTAEGRVDFRELVKILAAEFHTRIELRQIGVRDEAKLLGGLGVCGRQFCCTQYLKEFHPVSIKMAKIQGLSLNPTKISGTCGRLMCCLKYEDVAYEELVKKAPKVDAFVETPSGKGSVVSVNLLRRSAKVRLEEGLDATLKTFTFDELDILGGKGRRAEYVAAKAEGRLLEAGFSMTPKQEPRLASASSQKTGGDTTHGGSSGAASGGSHGGSGAASGGSQGVRTGAPSAQSSSRKPGERYDRRPAQPDPRKKTFSPAVERLIKESEKTAMSPRPQPKDGAQSKKPYFKRYKGGHGKGK